MKRSREMIISEILNVCGKDGASQSQIIHQVNLNSTIVKPYLEMLTNNGMINRKIVNGKTLYELTEKGSELQDNYNQIQSKLLN